MRKRLYKLLQNLEKQIKSVLKILLLPQKKQKSELEASIEKWYSDPGHETRRFDYDLNSNSLVFDVGGYEGQWASDIYARYNCRIFVFEPYLPFADKIEQRFQKNNQVTVFKSGLGSVNETISFANMGDASSGLRPGQKSEQVCIKSITGFIWENNISSVDLIKINIEGGEYDLLESMIESKVLGCFKNIQVQFHDFVEHANERMAAIQQELEKTHVLTYQYKYVWENWRLKV